MSSSTNSQRQRQPSWWEWIGFQWTSLVHSGIPFIFWNRPTWSASDEIPSQTGKVVAVTGGSSGTGYATALAEYNAGATVYLLCRNEEKTRKAMKQMERNEAFDVLSTIPTTTSNAASEGQITGSGEKRAGTGRLEFIELKLDDLESVERCAQEFLRRETKLDVLFANAGIMAVPEGQWTQQGYSMQFGTNALGHHRLITLLLPTLVSSNRANDDPARVIITSSMGHNFAPPNGVDYRSVTKSTADPTGNSPKKGKYELDRWAEYGQSKWANIAFAKYLNKHYGYEEGSTKLNNGQRGLISVAVHPGSIATNLPGHLSLTALLLKYCPWIVPFMTFTAADGASNQLYAATTPLDVVRQTNMKGGYIVPWLHVGEARWDLDDEEKVEELWRWCDEQGKKAV